MQSKRLATYSKQQQQHKHGHRAASTLFTCYVMRYTRYGMLYVVCWKLPCLVRIVFLLVFIFYFFSFSSLFSCLLFGFFHIQISCMNLCNQHNGSLFYRFIFVFFVWIFRNYWKWFHRWQPTMNVNATWEYMYESCDKRQAQLIAIFRAFQFCLLAVTVAFVADNPVKRDIIIKIDFELSFYRWHSFVRSFSIGGQMSMKLQTIWEQ